ncbi:hypothetical protein [Companilactobacillus furfuricola]|uniref:hypothetical protein n=1 Tax=Companilactobacillus furfuricola TaxID=1462575 RepID=UPI000F7BB103|nr:hypothetical protein [Companilactobacillus furfuricola]
MKFTKGVSAVLASVAALSFAVGPVFSVGSTQSAEATSIWDLPEGTTMPSEGKLMALNYEPGETTVFLWSFDGNNIRLSNRGVANYTWWYTDKYRVYDGDKYYRVSTNEWVNYNDMDQLELNNGDWLLGAQIRG